MYHVVFVFQNQDGSTNFEHECTIPALPRKGDLIGIQHPTNRPFNSALGRIKHVVIVVDPREATVHQNRALIVSKILIQSQEESIDVRAIAI